MVEYSRDGFHDCVGGRRVIFAGDSTIRQIYWAAATRLDHMKAHVALLDVFVDDSKHDNLLFEAEGVKLEFIWDPWLNSSGLHSELAKFRAQETFADVGAIKSKDEESAALIIIGSPGLWAARHGGEEYLDDFKRGIEGIRIHISSNLDEHLLSPTKDLRRNYDQAPNQILLAPVQVPWYDLLSHDRAVTITPDRINEMNQYLAGLTAEEQSHILWAYNKMTLDDAKTFEMNGIHVVDRVAEGKIDLALNARCNAATGHKIPHEGTCCMKYPEKRLLHVAVSLGAVIATIWVLGVSSILTRYRFTSVIGLNIHSNEVQAAFCFLLIILEYCDATDRRHMFLKLSRQYDSGMFIGACAVFWLLSMLSWRSSSRPVTSSSRVTAKSPFESAMQSDKGFLSRDQSNEMKGWMQAMILLYHYHHASQILWVYKLIRLLVSGYIFLTGYGHTTYLLRTGDYSLRRTAAVIFRLNLLSAVLPYVMDTDYNFYYFAPVITFWYVVVYITLRVFRRYNQDPVLLLAKIVVAAVLTSCFIHIPQPLRLLSTICRKVFHMPWDSAEAHFRLTIDRYVVFFGMITASIVHRMSLIRTNQSLSTWREPADPRANRPSLIDPVLAVLVFPDVLTEPIKPLACAFSALFIMFFAIVTQTQVHDKMQYNIAHPYMSWIPVLSFLIIRNSYQWMRNSYLAIPAALGKISLETYILQYHIWLGNDATAKLRLGIWDRNGSPTWFAAPGRYLEILLISAVFICLSVHARYATEALTKWLFYASPPSVMSGPIEGRSTLASKDRSSEDEKERPVFGFGGNHENDTSYASHHNVTGRFGRLGHFLARDVRAKVLVMIVILWMGNLFYA